MELPTEELDSILEKNEEAKWIPNYRGEYIATTLGRIFSVKSGTPKEIGFERADGYLGVNLFKSGKREQFGKHRLILETFKGNPPEDKQITRHLDGNIKNNVVSNLKWGDNKENAYDALKHGNQKHQKLTESDIISIREQYAKGTELRIIANNFDISKGQICNIAKGKSWSHVGGPITKKSRQNPQKKLTKMQADKIRQEYKLNKKMTYKDLSAKYNISFSTVGRIIRNEFYKN